MPQDRENTFIDDLREQVSEMLNGLPQELPIAATVAFKVNNAKENIFASNAEVLADSTRRLPGCNVFAYHERRPDSGASSGNTVEVVAEKTAKAGSDEAAKEALERIEIKEESSPSAIRIETHVERTSGWFGGNAQVLYTVRVPASADARARRAPRRARRRSNRKVDDRRPQRWHHSEGSRSRTHAAVPRSPHSRTHPGCRSCAAA